ncbi:DUF4249 domain-containing protein (plasmid) [Bernardetia sp. Wsw4-3y2]|uniref:DUF4249 domain-containing protein n=1 Tax=Bernardetia sp. Wsw4-3y2 TaxID=3127471 RepID=UPI0030D10656
MKNIIKSILFILISLFLLPSCGDFLEDVDVKGDNEIAVVGFISPDDSLVQVALYRAIGIGQERDEEEGEDYIQNAVVRISDGQNSYVMNYGKNPYSFEDLGNGYFNYSFEKPQFTYQIENSILNVSEGKTYTLEIETDKGEKLSAKCTVPIGKVTPIVNLTKFNEQEYNYEAQWEDNFSTTNYYRLEAYQPSGGTGQTRTLYFENNYFKSQEGRNTITYKPEDKIYFYDYPYVTTYLMKTDENYYRYHKSVEDAYNNEGNPFGEPIIIHSNIKNGIGCFGAYITAKVITRN